MKARFNRSVGVFGMIAAFVFTILALVFSLISDSRGNAGGVYGVPQIGMIIAFCVVCAVFALLAVVLDCVFEGRVVSVIADVLRFAIAALLIVCLCFMISSHGDLMGYIWWSDIEANNVDAVAALNMAVVSWIMYFLGIAACAVSLATDMCGSETYGEKKQLTENKMEEK